MALADNDSDPRLRQRNCEVVLATLDRDGGREGRGDRAMGGAGTGAGTGRAGGRAGDLGIDRVCQPRQGRKIV